MLIYKMLSLGIAIWFTFVNLVRASRKKSVPAINFIIMSGAIVSFVYLMGWLQ